MPAVLATDYKVFSIWIVITHFANILFMVFMVRSGLEILSAFPKFYLSDDGPPGHEWLCLTRRVYSADAAHTWSSLDEEESWSPVIALPGRKNLGLGRHWHFMTLQLWVANGTAYFIMLVHRGVRRRPAPTPRQPSPSVRARPVARMRRPVAPLVGRTVTGRVTDRDVSARGRR
jgi:hypothetical protein